jgi:hypothetical protein
MKSKEEEAAATSDGEKLGKWSIRRVEPNEPQFTEADQECPHCAESKHTTETWQQAAESWQQAAADFEKVAEQNRHTAET